jgi:DNA-directed RNA polymerase specialized sigma24 family protein
VDALPEVFRAGDLADLQGLSYQEIAAALAYRARCARG